jgi:hypothetical protein
MAKFLQYFRGVNGAERRGTPFRLAFSQQERRSGCCLFFYCFSIYFFYLLCKVHQNAGICLQFRKISRGSQPPNPRSGRGDPSRTHPQYGRRPYAGAAPQSYRSRCKNIPFTPLSTGAGYKIPANVSLMMSL